MIVYTHSAYGSFGEINPIRYRSYFYDFETGFYYLQSRYYDPAIRRFISADDPNLLGANGTFLSYNLYAYCENNPVKYKDEGGTSVVAAIGATVGATIGAKALFGSGLTLFTVIAGSISSVLILPNIINAVQDFVDGLSETIAYAKAKIVSFASALVLAYEKAKLRDDDGTALHHIIPKSAAECALAICLMESVGIGRNDPENLVRISKNLHYYIHTKSYYAGVSIIIYSSYMQGKNNDEKRNKIIASLRMLRAVLTDLDSWLP